MRICWSCSKVQAKMSTCLGCRTVSYCSKKCQKADWPVHKPQCETLFNTGDIGLDLGDATSAPFLAHAFLGEFIEVRHGLREIKACVQVFVALESTAANRLFPAN